MSKPLHPYNYLLLKNFVRCVFDWHEKHREGVHNMVNRWLNWERLPGFLGVVDGCVMLLIKCFPAMV